MRHRFLLSFPIALVLLFCLSGCAKYKEADFLGKSSVQIVSEFGDFDCCLKPADNDRFFRNTACGYTVQVPQAGFLGTTEERIFFIHFDANGIAYDTHEDYRPGG